jgi:peptide/nickel transport system substrate-binding protein
MFATDGLVDQQSAESDINKRRQLVWEIERKLAEDDARPILFYPAAALLPEARVQGVCCDGQQHLQ